MPYGKIADKEFDLIREGKEHSERAENKAKKLTAWLEELLNSEYPIEAWGTKFTPRQGGLHADLETPFGSGRVVTVLSLGEGGVQARYVFEKKFTNERDEPAFTPVWAVRVSPGGIVKTDDGEHTIMDMNAISKHQRDNGVVEIALSAIYAIAKCDAYWVPSRTE